MALGSLWKKLKLSDIAATLSWLDWLGLAVVVVLLCVLGFLIWRRKYGKDSTLVMPALIVPTKLLLPPDCLLKVWRGFVREIPWRLRPNALRAPLSLVIGEAGCGKTSIIDRYADWQGQEFRFHPSAIDDLLMQVYLGSKSLVLEFGASLLYDTTPAAYTAIKKLWRHIPPSPQVVMVIDATTLLIPEMDQLRESGHALFGKLKVFGEQEGKPLPLILVLSHMDRVPGFIEFCVFLEEAGISLQLDFPESDGISQLEFCLEGYQAHLNRALVTRPTQDYLKIVRFLDEAPRLFRVLVDFLRVAGLEQDVASPPVVRLCLLSEQVHSFDCQPFALPFGKIDRPRFILNGHAKAALALLIAGLVYLIGSYSYEKNMVAETRKNILAISSIPIQHYEEKISPLFLDFGSNLNKNPELSFMPNFFLAVQQYNNYLLIAKIREQYLIPRLKEIQFEPDATFKTTRFLAVLYATPTNEVGNIVLRRPEKTAVNMALYGQLIDDYITHNTRTDDLDHILNQINYAKLPNTIQDNTLWIGLFRSFKQILGKPFIQETELKELQDRLVPFMAVINRLEYYKFHDQTSKWLEEHTSLHLEHDTQVQLRQKSITDLLQLVGSLRLDTADGCRASLSLSECLVLVQAVATDKTGADTAEIVIHLDGNDFSFTPKQWNELISRSRISIILHSLMSNHRNHDGWVFFNASYPYADVEMNSSNNGGMLFAGKARIDGRLTLDAFEQNVKPAIMALTDIVAKLPIDASEKKYFSDFVLKSLGSYSDNYVSAYLNYFKQFQIHIDSTWGLNYVLDNLQQPNSPLLETLVQIKNNTALNFPASPNFQLFAQKLTVFRFIQRLMEEKNGVYPEFQKYQFLMAQMQHEMDPSKPYLPKKIGDDAAAQLKGVLTPIGRVAWAMLLNEDGAYSTLVKSWLVNAGIQDDWQQPFLAPVQKVQKFGTDEINQHIAGIWSDIWDSNVAPLLIKFPFMPTAGRNNELALQDLINTFHPKQGVFWDTFEQYLSPLSTFNNGVWVKRHDLSEGVKLPANYLRRLNAAQQLTANLWDVQGNPKPLEFSVKPGLLPTFNSKQIPRAPLVSLTYLRKGESSVLGFNQQADWQKLPLDWWTVQSAEVGMEFRKDADPTRVYTDLAVTDSAWNFFRLLQQGQSNGSQRYRWQLAHPNFPKQPLNLEFSFQANPLAVFANLAGS